MLYDLDVGIRIEFNKINNNKFLGSKKEKKNPKITMLNYLNNKLFTTLIIN